MSARRRTLFGAVLAACISMTPAVMPHANAGDTGRYVGGGTAAVRNNGQPVADEGSVICDNGDGVGTGGVCLKFGGGDAVRVADEAAGENVAFQVCVDNSGDGVCTSPDFGACADQVFFSHDDAGNFYNPVGPLPTGFTSGCAGGPWKGYVVMLCEGVHVASNAHSHPASSGTATVTATGSGEGLGNFCGGTPVQQSRKPYTVGSGARYMSGGTAVARKDGQPAVDEGSMVCNNGDNVGVGGFCTSFGGGDAMAVFDAASGTDVAFQVCVDNSGDGVCTSPDTRTNCPDQVFFSHDDNGAFYNPLGPIPTGFSSGCAGGPWKGYVVFLCEGTHAAGTSAHAHAATTGTGRVTTGGEGVGTFCGGSHASPSNKRYALDFRPPEVDPPPVGPVFILTSDGECSVRLANQSGLSGQSFIGQADVVIVARDAGGVPDPTAAITNVSCELRINGVSQGTILTAPNGTGVTANSARTETTATETDQLTLCTNATIRGESRTRCVDAEITQTPPQSAVDALESIRALAKDVVTSQTDPTTCAGLLALAPVVNSLNQPNTIRIDPSTGDVFLFNTLFQDCPPYEVVLAP